jgi:hypothetical protein
LDVAPIDPNVKQEFDKDAVFVKVYASMGLTGQTGPNGDGDIDGMDEGTSSFYRMVWSLNQFSSDEGWWVWADAGVPQVRSCSWNSSNDLVKGLYYRLYFDITLCNLFLEETAALADENTARQRAEARFIRALNYYYLLDMYGEGVPHALKVNETPLPITRKDLYNWVITELKDVETAMFADGAKAPYYYRADQVAAWLLLARTYLNAEVYTGAADWNNAALYAGKVMSSSYQLATEYKHLFMGDNNSASAVNKASQEIILSIAQDGTESQSYGGSWWLIAATHINGMNFTGTSDQWSCIRSKTNLVQKWFPDLAVAATHKGDENTLPAIAGDDRCLLANYVEKTLVGSTGQDSVVVTFEATLEGGAGNGDVEFPKSWAVAKFTNVYVSGEPSHNATTPDMDVPFMRVAEAYLTYAEAVHRGGAATNGSALDAVNALRRRAHAAEWTTITDDVALLDEWSREFYFEGRRRSDLVRFGKFAGNVNYNWEGKGGTATGTDVDAKYNIFPIPYSDLMANPNLRPSEGY